MGSLPEKVSFACRVRNCSWIVEDMPSSSQMPRFGFLVLLDHLRKNHIAGNGTKARMLNSLHVDTFIRGDMWRHYFTENSVLPPPASPSTQSLLLSSPSSLSPIEDDWAISGVSGTNVFRLDNSTSAVELAVDTSNGQK